MFALDSILNIPDCDLSTPQMGLTTKQWAVIRDTGATKDGKKPSPSLLKQNRKNAPPIKGDIKLSDVRQIKIDGKTITPEQDAIFKAKVKRF